MKLTDIIHICLRNLSRRKFRTFLTVIGVVIGTAAIVVMVSFGIASSQSINDLIASWGDLSIIDVYGYDPQTPLDDDAVKQIRAIRGVETVTPFSEFYDGRPQMVSGRRDRYRMEYTSLVGVYPDALEKLGYELLDGIYLPETANPKKIQILFGEQAAYQFTDTRRSWPGNYVHYQPDEFGNIPDPFVNLMTDEIRMEVVGYTSGPREQKLEYEIEVIGVMKGDPRNYYTMYGAFISIRDMQKIMEDFRKLQGNSSGGGRGQYGGYNSVKVKAANINIVSDIEEAIHNIGFPSTHSLEAQRKSAQESVQRTQMIFGGLGAMALVVAAISIANTMVTSVYERTREIGVMKVLGCLVSNIRTIFLVEASLIGFFGGVAGLILSFILSFLMNLFSASITEGLGNIAGGGFYMPPGARISIIPGWLVLASLLFATLIGLISGFLPANRAVKISALEAIKQE